MAFVRFPVLWAEDDFEKKESLGLEVECEEGDITINTKMICAYNEMGNENVMCRMSNGDAYEIPMCIHAFEDILQTVDSLVTLSDITEN